MEVDKEVLRAVGHALDIIRETLENEAIIHQGQAEALADASRLIGQSIGDGELGRR